ncbi:ATP-binding protein [candidate division KSB1 bacterium]|nr:ATP-binding protein [candidate division KSB1 bacterium]
MFVNREYELKSLNREYKSKKSSFTIIYGRRRIGKTALIREYIKDKPALYFYATESSMSEQLAQFTLQMMKMVNPALQDIRFPSFEQALIYLADQIKDKKLILVIDEYQNLVKADRALSSTLQKVWDLYFQQKNIHLILCGSILSMMYSETLDYSSPLYGRRTGAIHLKQLPAASIRQFMHVDDQDLMSIYAAFGTVPRYLELYDAHKNFYDNVSIQILSKTGYLYNETRFILKEEIEAPSTYFQILSIIASGEQKIGKIAARMGVHASHLTRYLFKLIDLDILERQVPITESDPTKSKLGRYRIKDKFFAFWFYYVYRNLSLLELFQIKPVLEMIKADFNEKFVSYAFEDYVRELLLSSPQQYLGFIPDKIGRWWNNREEIDLVALNDQHVAFIECKWQNQHVGYEIYQHLQRKAELLGLEQKHHYILFAKKGFKASLKEADCKAFSYLRSTP